MASGRRPDLVSLIDRYQAAWNAQDLDAIASMHGDAIVFRRSLRCGEDFAASEWTARAAHPDDGRRLEGDGVDLFGVTAHGRIARKDVYSSSGTPRVVGP